MRWNMEEALDVVSLERLYQQLSALELREQEIHSKSRPHIKKRQEDIANGTPKEFADAECATKIGWSLEGLASIHEKRDELRKVINFISLPKIRSLTILDLPTELLTDIFSRICTGNKSDNIGVGLKDIQNVRLTCQRFCGTSSHVLMSRVNVDCTKKGIDHLLEVAHHPQISRGIRSVHVDVSFYSQRLAADFPSFKARTLRILRIQNNLIQRFLQDKEGDSSLDMARSVGHQVQQMAATLRESSDDIQTFLSEIATDQSICKVLADTWKQYCDCVLEQQQLQAEGKLPQTIAQALLKMPMAINMLIHDKIGRTEYSDSERIRTFIKHPCDGDSVTSILTSLILHRSPWADRFDERERPPAEFLILIPLTLQKEGIFLRSFDVNLQLPRKFELQINDSDIHALENAARNIEHFGFQIDGLHLGSTSSFAKTPHDSPGLLKYISIMMNPRRTKSIILELPLYNARTTPSVSLGHLLTSPASWPQLQAIDIRGMPMHLSELKRFIHKTRCGLQKYNAAGQLICKEERVNVRLNSIDLVTGRWVDVLDIMRRCCGFASEINHDVDDDFICFVSDDEFFRAFQRFSAADYRGWLGPVRRLHETGAKNNKATDYIRRRLKRNPLK